MKIFTFFTLSIRWTHSQHTYFFQYTTFYSGASPFPPSTCLTHIQFSSAKNWIPYFLLLPPSSLSRFASPLFIFHPFGQQRRISMYAYLFNFEDSERGRKNIRLKENNWKNFALNWTQRCTVKAAAKKRVAEDDIKTALKGSLLGFRDWADSMGLREPQSLDIIKGAPRPKRTSKFLSQFQFQTFPLLCGFGKPAKKKRERGETVKRPRSL